jgi:hypothetical protein
MAAVPNGTVTETGAGTAPPARAGCTAPYAKVYDVRGASWPGGVVTKVAEVRVYEPDAGANRGTIVLLAGGQGEGFYSDTAGGELVLEALLARHWRVCELAWTSGGWFNVPWGGPVVQHAQAVTAILEYIQSAIHVGGAGVAFRLVGNSGGSAAIAYGLANWGLHTLTDRVVLASGPPMADMTKSCASPPDPAFIAWVDARWPAGMQCDPIVYCNDPEAEPPLIVCEAIKPGGADPEESVLNSTSVVDYPDTEVRFLWGGSDCSGATVAQALIYEDAIESAKAVRVVDGAEHWMPGTPQGVEAVVLAVNGRSNDDGILHESESSSLQVAP